MIGAFDSDLKCIPNSQISVRFSSPIVGLENAFVHKRGNVEFVVIVKANDANGDSVKVG